MKISFILLTVCLLQVTATGFSQNVAVSLHSGNMSLEQLFAEIEKQTDVRFLYRHENIAGKTAKINAENTPVSVVLNEALHSNDLNYTLMDNNLIVVASEVVKAQQGITITGAVTDANGDPLPGASIVIKGTQQGTVTDANGAYSIAVPNEDAVLVFSFVGFVGQEFLVGNQRAINVSMSEDSRQLEEVVVVGYGTQKKVNLSGSVSSVNLETLGETRAVSNLTQALQGQMSGLMIQQTSGLPGAESMSILVRGQGTLNNSSPLVIVDGIVGALSDVSPADVASVSVLKDAASAAIYGSRAANGVILITTKHGAKDKTSITYNGYVGYQKPTLYIDVVDDYVLYMETINKARENAGQPWYYQQDIIDEWREGTKAGNEIYANTNWYKEVFRPALIQDHTIQASGSAGKSDFMFSIGYQGNTGCMPETNFNRYNLRVNLGAQIKPFIRAGININGYHSISQINDSGTISTYLGYMSNSTPGTLPKSSDGIFGGEWAPGGNMNANNIFGSFESHEENNWNTRIQAKPYIQVNFTPNVTWNTSLGVMFHNGFGKWTEYPVNYYNLKTKEPIRAGGSTRLRLDEDHQRAKRFVVDSYANWNLPIRGDHHLNFLAGFNQEYEQEETTTLVGFDMVSIETDVMDAISDWNKPGGGFANRSLRSVFGRFNYDYKGRYLFEANLRYDGSSKFAKGHRWGYFPSFSAAWRISEESFIKNITWINNLKIRGSYGTLGNNRSGDYATQSLYTASNAVLNNTVTAGMAPSGIANETLTWESTTMTNIGMDLNVFHNRLSLETDVFYKKTDGILLQLPVPQVALGGTTTPWQNAAEVSNLGFEITFRWNDRILKELNYGVNINYTFVRNHVDKYRGDFATYSGQRILKEGLKIYPYYVREVERIATQEIIDEMLTEGYQFYPSTPNPGDFIYKDQQGPEEAGHKIINDDDRVVKGNSTPEQTFGFSLYANWNGIDFSALFQGVAGFNRYLNDGWYTNVLNNSRQINKKFLNAWDAETNPNSKIPAITTDDGSRNTVANDFWLQNASYLRVKNIQIGYTLPTDISWKFFVERLRVYLSAENLLTFTRYEGLDPEQGGSGNYPNLKRYVCGISVTF